MCALTCTLIAVLSYVPEVNQTNCATSMLKHNVEYKLESYLGRYMKNESKKRKTLQRKRNKVIHERLYDFNRK